MPKKQPLIFLSYRREDARNAVEELHRILVNKYGAEGVFRDTRIDVGTPFPPLLSGKVRQADAVVVVIGQRWIREPRPGEEDWVVEEVAIALESPNTKIFPVLVEDASFPVDKLPPRIERLKDRQHLPLRPAHFVADANRLLRALPKPPADEAIDAKNLGRLEKIDSKQQHEDRVSVLAWGPDGKTLVSGGEDGSVAWWKRQTARTQPGHSAPVRDIAFSTDGKLMLSLSADALRMWTHPGGKLHEETKLRFDEGHVFSMAISPVEPIFIVSRIRNDPELYTIPEAELEGPLPNRTMSAGPIERARVGWHAPKPFLATALAFSHDGDGLATGSPDGSVLLWTNAKPGLVWKERLASKAVSCLAFSRSGGYIASGSEGRVCVYNLDGSALMHHDVDGPVNGVAFSPDGKLLACALENGATLLLDVEKRSPVARSKPVLAEATGIAFSPDGTRLAQGKIDGHVELWAVA